MVVAEEGKRLRVVMNVEKGFFDYDVALGLDVLQILKIKS